MKQLLLIRHAKSSWDLPGSSDHDRPLNARGERDAPAMAAALSQRGVAPDAIVTSTATRAVTTARMIAEGLGFPESSVRENRDLYLAGPRTILSVVQQFDEGWNTVMLFGHNPGMHETADLISSDRSIDRFPTLAVARLELNIEYWAEADSGCGLLLELLTPKTLQDD